jgi:hypothetical protein
VLVFLIFMPRRPRALAAWCILLFQLAIVLTGNYGFFNLLTMALCVFLFDDAALRHLFPQRAASWIKIHAPQPGMAATAIATVVALIVVPVGFDRVWRAFAGIGLPVVGALTDAISPLLIVSGYGPFATTTMTRPEIIVEGSDDGQNWRPYVFRYKPGPLDRLSWNIPHQPRLDWQMWFAAYGSSSENPWFGQFLRKLLEGRAPVLALLASNPFPDHPPKYVQALLFDYRFSDPGEFARTGQWWVHRQAGLYASPVSLADFSHGPSVQTPPARTLVPGGQP